jgi:hypothetical protein
MGGLDENVIARTRGQLWVLLIDPAPQITLPRVPLLAIVFFFGGEYMVPRHLARVNSRKIHLGQLGIRR